MKLILNAPINPLSLGQFSYNLIRELWKMNADIAYFPIGPVQLEAFQPKKELVAYIQDAINKRHTHLSRDTPTLKVWHLVSQNKEDPFQALLTPNQTLLSFHETDSVTPFEKTMAEINTKTLFCGNYSEGIFRQAGCENVGSFNIGWDEDFQKNNKKYLDSIHWGIVGKREFRKNTEGVIKAWIKKYGNNRNHSLTCLITNPFLSPEDNQRIIASILEGKRIWNVSFLPHIKTNAEMCDFYNAIDIDLSGASFSESWGIPAFSATGLGKWSVVNNFGGHKAWANSDNSILFEPDGMQDCYDGVFFNKGNICNQGRFSKYSEDSLIHAMERAENVAKMVNLHGKFLQEKFTMSKIMKQLLVYLV